MMPSPRIFGEGIKIITRRNLSQNVTTADANSALGICSRHIINYPKHVLHKLLPPPTTASQQYNLRSRRHTLQLAEHHTSLIDS